MHWAIDPKMFDALYSGFEQIYPGQTEAKTAQFVVGEILSYLMKRALNGDSPAIRAITKIAREATWNVERLTREEPKKIRELAERDESFPILISPHKDMSGRVYIKEKINLLNIGALAAINTSGFDIRPSEGQPFKDAIHLTCDRLLRAINGVRNDVMLHSAPNQPRWRLEALKLPPLSEHTCRSDAESWFVVAWQALCEATLGRPEDLPQLKHIGKYKEQKAIPAKESSSRQGKFSNAKQAGLHERLKAAWLARYARVK
jgi:hypothetical protein